ncbi:MAG: hypothetical protein D6798_11260 [Deltaproteobacteria bacterium]|nr:MAG: hypothetical protein D6798_11260 [Deltaproteobacteria bacterium]
MSVRLLEAWKLARYSPAAWRASFRGDDDAESRLRAVATAIAMPGSPEATVKSLLEAGEFDSAEMLLRDDQFQASLEAGDDDRFERLVEDARRSHMERLRLRLEELAFRGEAVGVRLDVDELLRGAGSDATTDLKSVEALEASIREAERAAETDLLAKLDERLHEPAPGAEAWAESIRRAVSAGALDAARAMLEAGPSRDLPEAFAIPPPPVWPFRDEPLERVVGWFHHEGAIPPGFGRFAPSHDDEAAKAFLASLRGLSAEMDESLPRALAAVLDSKVVRVDESSEGLTVYLDDLSAPGLHAFARRAWPAGVPVWVSDDPDAPDPDVEEGGLVVRLVLGQASRRRRQVLHLHVHDVLAVLHDGRRRARLLAVLARQLPTERAFETVAADTSIRWHRRDVPDLLGRPGGKPALLVAAPGMGKSTLLQELATQGGAEVVDASVMEDLPEAPAVFIDGLEVLDTGGLKRVVKEIHWACSSRSPAPVIVVAARPEGRFVLERIRMGSIFEVVVLRPRSIASLREQATTMLGWVGITSDDPGAYTNLAMLAGGNPTVLFYLCQALADVLVAESTRSFTRRHVDKAWATAPLRRALRGLLWEPLCHLEGVPPVLKAIADYASPEAPLSRKDLAWLLTDVSADRDATWLDERVQLLVDYGLVHRAEAGVRLAVGGPALLVSEWLK